MPLKFGDGRRRGVIETCSAVELAHSGLHVDADWLLGGESSREGLQGLQTAVERRAVNQVDWGIKLHEMLAKLGGLLDSMSGEDRIGGNASGRRNVGVVFSSGRVDIPIQAEL